MRHLLLSQVLHARAAIETKIYKVCHIFSEPKARLLPPALFQGTRQAPIRVHQLGGYCQLRMTPAADLMRSIACTALEVALRVRIFDGSVSSSSSSAGGRS